MSKLKFKGNKKQLKAYLEFMKSRYEMVNQIPEVPCDEIKDAHKHHVIMDFGPVVLHTDFSHN